MTTALEQLASRLRVHAFTSHRENTKRYFFHHDMPLPIDCGLLGHKPVLAETPGYGTVYHWVECARCGLRPSYVEGVPAYTDGGASLDPLSYFRRAEEDGYATWLPRRAESSLEISSSLVDHFAVQMKIGTLGSERYLGGHVVIPGWRGFYWGTSLLGRRLVARRSRKPGAESRVTGLVIDKDCVRWKVHHPRDRHSSDTPKWRYGSWYFLDTLLGKTIYDGGLLARAQTFIDMPEGRYPAVMKLKRQTWRRPRLPYGRTELSVEVEVDGGIPSGRQKWGDWDSVHGFGFAVPEDAGESWIANARSAAATKVFEMRAKNAGYELWDPPPAARAGTRLVDFNDQASIEAWLTEGTEE